ncbi:MAG TPA: HD domain-containing protein [Anaerolineae bacterium]|nr:HD domain-containing protein [Anaerolineae bacterium]
MSSENLEQQMEVTPSEPAQRGVIYPIKLPARHNPKLQALVDRLNADPDLYALWECANVNAVTRLGMSDHGPVHVRLIANIALRLLRLLAAKGITPNIVKDHGLTLEDAEVVVSLGALMHDLGMSIHRIDHEQYSLFVAQMKLRETLPAAYPDARTAAIIRSEVLHAIISHRSEGRPLTLEAGVVRVADALDMAKGRSRIPFEAGMVNIHSLSATAIDNVTIAPGADKPIRITIRMNNSAGIFQVDELLKEKLKGSGLEPHLEVEATIEGEAERKLIQVFRL